MQTDALTASGVTPDALFQSLLAAAKNTQAKDSLTHIKAACDTLARHGTAINASTVGKECIIQFEGPTPGSIRNNRAYMSYIAARASAVAQPKDAQGKPVVPVITDPALDAYVTTLKGRLLLAERKGKLLREFLETRVEPLDIDKFLAEQDPVRFGHLMPKPEPTVVSPAPTALPAILSDPAHLAKFGLEIAHGRIISSLTGEELVKL